MSGPGFVVEARLTEPPDSSRPVLGRTGTWHTPHGLIRTPAFIPVGTKATVKAVLPEMMAELGAQALLANAYHLYLQPGAQIVEEAGGLGSFMNWSGPTFTDSGGFQVLSLGVGFKKVIAMESAGVRHDDVVAAGKDRLAQVDDDGVTFKSHLDGSMHRFTPEVSMQVQHQLGADIIFAFDECTTLLNTRGYQESSVARTQDWARRCLLEHARLTAERAQLPYQQLLGVVQGAQYEDLRRQSARGLVSLGPEGQGLSGTGFDGFGIGGALQKAELGTIVRWVCEELPDTAPRHLLGIGDPIDLFTGVEQGADTFDCVAPTRNARNAAIYTRHGRFNITASANRRAFAPIDEECGCYTCRHYTRAYLHHAFRAKEMIAATLASIHNEYCIVQLVEGMRLAIEAGTYWDYKEEVLGRMGLALAGSP